MKRLSKAIIAAALFAFLAAGAAYAHPPKNIDAEWNNDDSILTVTAKHNVNDPEKHYILSMSIYEGNNQLIQKQYTKQDSAEGFKDSVVLTGIPSGTKLRIQVLCNIMGSAEAEFTVP